MVCGQPHGGIHPSLWSRHGEAGRHVTSDVARTSPAGGEKRVPAPGAKPGKPANLAPWCAVRAQQRWCSLGERSPGSAEHLP